MQGIHEAGTNNSSAESSAGNIVFMGNNAKIDNSSHLLNTAVGRATGQATAGRAVASIVGTLNGLNNPSGFNMENTTTLLKESNNSGEVFGTPNNPVRRGGDNTIHRSGALIHSDIAIFRK